MLLLSRQAWATPSWNVQQWANGGDFGEDLRPKLSPSLPNGICMIKETFRTFLRLFSHYLQDKVSRNHIINLNSFSLYVVEIGPSLKRFTHLLNFEKKGLLKLLLVIQIFDNHLPHSFLYSFIQQYSLLNLFYMLLVFTLIRVL